MTLPFRMQPPPGILPQDPYDSSDLRGAYGVLPNPRAMAPRPGIQVAPGVESRLPFQSRLQRGLFPIADSFRAMLSGGEEEDAGKRGLLAAGLKMLQMSGPSEVPQGLGQILAGGILAGQGATQGAVGETLAGNEAQAGVLARRQQQDMVSERRSVFDSIQVDPNAPVTHDTIRRASLALPELLKIGDYEGAKLLTMYLQANTENKSGGAAQHVDLGKRTAILDHQGKVLQYLPNDDMSGSTAAKATTDNQRAGMENTILDNFRQGTTVENVAAQGYGVIRDMYDSAKAGNAYAMHSLIVGFTKALDPGTAAREGEVAAVQKVGSLSTKFKNWIEQAEAGTLTPKAIEDIRDAAMESLQTRAQSFAATRDVHKRWGDRHGLNLDELMINPFDKFTELAEYQRRRLGGGKVGAGNADAVRKALEKK